MKKLWLIALFFNVTSFCFAKNPFSFATGQSVSCNYVNLQSFQTKDSWNFGIAISSDNLFKKSKIIIKSGNLSVSGSISRLNNPCFSSSISPFSIIQTKTSKIEANFSGSNSFSKPISYFMEYIYSDKKKIFNQFYFNFLFIPKDSISFSTNLDFKFTKNISVSVLFASGLFIYKNLSSSSWYLDKNYYKNGIQSASLFQSEIKINNLKALFSMNLYETPFGKFEPTYKIESNYNINHWIFNLGVFYCPNDLISSAQKNISSQLQLKTGINYSFIKIDSQKNSPSPVLFKIGTNIYSKIQEQSEIKIKPGFSITKNTNNFICNAGIIFFINKGLYIQENKISSLKTKIDSISFSISDSFFINSVKIKLGTNINFENDKNNLSEKLIASMSFNIKKTSSLLGTISFSTQFFQTDLKYQKNENNINFSIKYKWNWLCLSGKISYSF